MKYPAYVGIDPGAGGGIAVLDRRGRYDKAVPLKAFDRAELLTFLRTTGGVAQIELVTGFVGGTGFKAGSSAMFNFGVGYGLLLGFLLASGIPFEKVHPNVWQRRLGIPPRGRRETKTDYKNRLKDFAADLFPTVKVTHATADALLIATHCYRKHSGKL